MSRYLNAGLHLLGDVAAVQSVSSVGICADKPNVVFFEGGCLG